MKKTIILLATLLCAVAGNVTAQQIVPSLTGTDFWMAFLPNMASNSVRSLMFASEEDCTVYIENSSHTWDITVAIEANLMVQVPVPDNSTLPQSVDEQYSGSWHITASAPIIVYASNFANASHDMSAILPTATLRQDYITQTYASNLFGQEVSIVAPYDSTSVQIILAEDVSDNSSELIHHAGDTLHVMLMRGIVYLMSSNYVYYNYNIFPAGLCGARIHASKPVAVFQGHQCAFIPSNAHACDHIYEQCIPTDYWGQHFIVMPTTGRSLQERNTGASYIGDMVKVTARENNCIVTIDGNDTATLSRGDSYTFIVTNHAPVISSNNPPRDTFDIYQSDALFVNTSTPAMVCFYISGISYGGTPGDPASVIIPPIEQGIGHTIAAVYNTTLTQSHHINIVASNADAPLVTLDGQNIASAFVATAEGYSWARIIADTGTHVIDADTGRFLATFYGLGGAESYAYIAGMAVRSADYDVHANRHSLCPGDTVSITVKLNEEGLGTRWFADGQTIGDNIDTLSLAFDSVGRHLVTIVITPVGDTVWEILTVHPAYSSHSTDTICLGDSLQWQREFLTLGGLYIDSMLSINGCDSVESLQLDIFGVPHPLFTLKTDCENYHYSIFGSIAGDTTGYMLSWQATPPDNDLEGQPWDSLYLSPLQTTEYNIHIDGHCPYDTSFTLHPIQWPQAALTVRPEQLSIENPTFEAYDQSLNADSRRWWIDGVHAGEEPILRHRADIFADSVLLTLVAFNQSCADTLRHTLPIKHVTAWAPNVFTPDGESNKHFQVVINEGVTEELYIYNRNGMLVAHIVGSDAHWDGTHDGEPCSQGTYVWHLRYRRNDLPESLQTLTGTITLLR